MASPASRSASALPVNQGHQRENGTERTSATAVTPASLSKPTKRSAARLEWPMVKRSQAADRVIGSVEFLRFVPTPHRPIGRRLGRPFRTSTATARYPWRWYYILPPRGL